MPRTGTSTRCRCAVRNSVLDAILAIKGEEDGSIGIRCSCQQGICGSCGVRMNGKPGLACNTHLDVAAARGGGASTARARCRHVIEVEPMGNMPVIRDLIVDMDAVHWKKIRRVTPWLIAKQPVPEREYIVPHDNMVDVTQTMACIQCGACVSDCLSMEVDPDFIGPAALAKAYRFVGDPRDAEQHGAPHRPRRGRDGLYDCTHCFNCVDACPKEVAPMSQIMRLRRIAGSRPRHRGRQQRLPPRARVRQEHPAQRAAPRSRPAARFLRRQVSPAGGARADRLAADRGDGDRRGKMTLGGALGHPHKASPEVKKIFSTVEGRPQRVELNLYVSGVEEDVPSPEQTESES